MELDGYKRLEELEIGNRFSLPPYFADIYELVEKNGLPSLKIKYVEGISYPEGSLLYLGRNNLVKRLFEKISPRI